MTLFIGWSDNSLLYNDYDGYDDNNDDIQNKKTHKRYKPIEWKKNC